MSIHKCTVYILSLLAIIQLPVLGQTTKGKPNFVIILADDMGYSDIGAFGSEIHTPNLDRLAAQGLKMSQFYNASRCCPTRASLLSGHYPHNAGVGSMNKNLGKPAYQGYINKQSITIAEGLKSAGYFTMLSGKWHVGNEPDQWPLARGFDRFFGLIGGTSNYFYPHPFKLGPEDYFVLNDKKLDNYLTEVKPAAYYLTDEFGDYALQFLEEAKTQQKPFYLHLTFNAPHFPIQARAEDIAKYLGKYNKGWDSLRYDRYNRLLAMGVIKKEWQLSPRDTLIPAWYQMRPTEKEAWELKMAVYAAMIDRLDYNVGRVLNKLKEIGAEENTVVIFLSDNGASHEYPFPNRKQADSLLSLKIKALPASDPQSFASYEYNWAHLSNTPFRSFKHWEHEGGISTPFIVRYPRLIKAGSLNHQPAHIVDIQATIFDLAGVKYPSRYKGNDLTPPDGLSLLDVFKGKPWKGHDVLYWEHQGNKAVRKGEWKIVSSYPENKWRLFNMNTDRTELHDLSEKQPAKLHELIALFDGWATKAGVEKWPDINKR